MHMHMHIYIYIYMHMHICIHRLRYICVYVCAIEQKIHDYARWHVPQNSQFVYIYKHLYANPFFNVYIDIQIL